MTDAPWGTLAFMYLLYASLLGYAFWRFIEFIIPYLWNHLRIV